MEYISKIYGFLVKILGGLYDKVCEVGNAVLQFLDLTEFWNELFDFLIDAFYKVGNLIIVEAGKFIAWMGGTLPEVDMPTYSGELPTMFLQTMNWVFPTAFFIQCLGVFFVATFFWLTGGIFFRWFRISN